MEVGVKWKIMSIWVGVEPFLELSIGVDLASLAIGGRKVETFVYLS